MKTIRELLKAIEDAQAANFFYTARALLQIARKEFPSYPWADLRISAPYSAATLYVASASAYGLRKGSPGEAVSCYDNCIPPRQ